MDVKYLAHLCITSGLIKVILKIITFIRKTLKVLFCYDYASKLYKDAKTAQTLKELAD